MSIVDGLDVSSGWAVAVFIASPKVKVNVDWSCSVALYSVGIWINFPSNLIESFSMIILTHVGPWEQSVVGLKSKRGLSS